MYASAGFDLSSDQVHVWTLASRPSASVIARLKTLLSTDERECAERFGLEQNRESFMVARGTLRHMLGRYLEADPSALRFRRGPYGKPSLTDAEIDFSVTRSSGLVAYAFARGCDVGIDIERMRPGILIAEIVGRVLPPENAAMMQALPPVERELAFFQFWTRQEAYSKATGEGLTGIHNTPSSAWTLQNLSVPPGHVGAIAYSGNARAITTSAIDLTAALGKNVGRPPTRFQVAPS